MRDLKDIVALNEAAAARLAKKGIETYQPKKKEPTK